MARVALKVGETLIVEAPRPRWSQQAEDQGDALLEMLSWVREPKVPASSHAVAHAIETLVSYIAVEPYARDEIREDRSPVMESWRRAKGGQQTVRSLEQCLEYLVGMLCDQAEEMAIDAEEDHKT